MVGFDFYLTDEDFDRLMDAKEAAGRDDLSAAEYAKQLLIDAIRHQNRAKKHN